MVKNPVKLDMSKISSISTSYSGKIRLCTIQFKNGTRLHGDYDTFHAINRGELVYRGEVA